MGAEAYVLGFAEIDETQVAVVGGKGAHLGALSRIDGIDVPAGFVVTTQAFRRTVGERLHADDPEALRATIEAIAIPDEVAAAITARIDEHTAYAVRSSATAEDMPTASFAGQHD